MTAPPDEVHWREVAYKLISDCEDAAGTRLMSVETARIIAPIVARELAAASELGRQFDQPSF